MPALKYFMKNIALTLLLSIGAATTLLADGTNVFTLLGGGTNTFTNERERDSYAVGMILGRNWQQRGVDLDLDYFVRGVKDVQSGGPTLLTDQEMRETLQQFQRVIDMKRQQEVAQQATKNKADGEAFLASNKLNPGVIELTNGLQYKVITQGNGPTPERTNMVEVSYTGKLIDGTVFDSSSRHGGTAKFGVTQVIPGWTQALTMMPAGSEWEIYIPSDLAYGPQGSRTIPPNSVLIFDLKLISISAPPPPPAPAAPLTSDIIKVPSADEMKKGAKIEVIKPEDVQKLQTQTNSN
jgi:FKBP-type peptidyl-prolyl cis-trans isomerase FklB